MMKKSGRLIFDSSSSSSSSAALHGNLLLLGGAGGGLGFHGGGRSVLGMDEIGGGKRRPFFTSPEYLMMEDEYYDEQMLPEKKRRLTSEQVQFLEKSFEVENKLEPERKGELAKKLGLQPRQVAVWFQNRRARWKTKQLERDFEQLKALYDDLVTSHDSLVVDHDSLIVDNQRLRSEVMSLTEKLQAKTTTGYPNHQQHQPPVDDSDVLKPIISPFSPSDPVEPKTEDHLSSGSHISAVVDEEHPSQLVVDSDDSYYPEPEDGSFHGGCGYMVHSEEEDGSDNSGAYYSSGMFANVDAVMEQQQQLEAEVGAGVMGWWAWS